MDALCNACDHRVILRRISFEISWPIARDDRVHIEYVPTQVVTEYVRIVVQDWVDAVEKGFALAWAVQRGTAFLTTSTRRSYIRENFEISALIGSAVNGALGGQPPQPAAPPSLAMQQAPATANMANNGLVGTLLGKLFGSGAQA